MIPAVSMKRRNKVSECRRYFDRKQTAAGEKEIP